MNQPARGYGVFGPRGLEGYTYLIQEKRQLYGYNLTLGDLCVSTPQAARRMLAFLGDHRSMTEFATWNSGPHDPIFQLLPEHAPEMLTLGNYWMLRITHVERALEARGYPRQLETEVHFRITDDVVPGNDGDFVLRVTGGRGEVRRGGKGSVRIDVRGLATLYSGLRSPEGIRLAGQIDGSEHDLATAGALFAGPAPSMSDMF
jgi:predicted acetyltransferase